MPRVLSKLPEAWASVIAQFLRFASVGAAASLVQYAVLAGLVESRLTPPLAAAIVAYVVGAVCNYLANYHFTFASTANHAATGSKFAAVALMGLALNSLIFAAIHLGLGLHYIVAQVVASIWVLVFNFTLNRHWTFRPQTGAEQQ